MAIKLNARSAVLKKFIDKTNIAFLDDFLIVEIVKAYNAECCCCNDTVS